LIAHRGDRVRKLLLLTYHFPPSAASGTFRLLGFARHLPRLGWQPIVVAPPALPWEPVDPGLLGQVPADTPVCSVAYPKGRALKGLRWLFPHAIWLPWAWAACGRMIRKYQPDALLTSSPPHCVHLLGWYLKRRFGIPWIADFRDPWFLNGRPTSAGSRWPWFEARCEARVMRNADVIVANAPRATENLRESFPEQQHKMVTLTNGFDPESFPAAKPPAVAGEALHVIHAGEVYAGRDPRPFLDALEELSAESPAGGRRWRVSFLGRNCENGLDLPAEVRRRGLDALVTVGSQLPYAQVLQEMAHADLLLLLDSPGRRLGIPAKLYEYLGTGRPILALAEPDGDVAWALRQSGVLHRIAHPRDRGQIRQALVELTDALNEPQMVRAPEAPAAFTRAAIAGQLADCLNECLARSSAGAARPPRHAEPASAK
jgi:glycosyltransferase involved in cell wall biosynthesis